MKVMDWMADLLGLPSHFKFSESTHGGGVLQSSASEATLVALLAARSRAIAKLRASETSSERQAPVKLNVDSQGIDKLVGYCSDEAHSSVARAGLLGACKITKVQSDDDCRLRGDALRSQIEADIEAGLVPFYVVATLGTTSVCSYDDLEEIGLVCREFDLWLHVDAAYAGNSFVCPENRHFMRGIEVS